MPATDNRLPATVFSTSFHLVKDFEAACGNWQLRQQQKKGEGLEGRSPPHSATTNSSSERYRRKLEEDHGEGEKHQRLDEHQTDEHQRLNARAGGRIARGAFACGGDRPRVA